MYGGDSLFIRNYTGVTYEKGGKQNEPFLGGLELKCWWSALGASVE